MEQEEMMVSAKPSATSDDQVDIGSDTSTEVWLPSPESEAETAAATAVVPETNGQHHSQDLSSDGEYETPL